MNILVDPGSFDCANAGDVAMLVVARRRLAEEFPGARVHVFTDAPDALARAWPGATPVPHRLGREAWRQGGFLLGRAQWRLPMAVRRAWDRGASTARRRWPEAYADAVARRLTAVGAAPAGARAYAAAVSGADLYVVAGQGTLADEARVQAEAVLDTCERAQALGTPVAFLGQGVGPLRDPALRARVGAALARAVFVGLREGRVARALLDRAGVPAHALELTGDDAVELAHERRPASLGAGLGVHVRNAPLAAARAEDRDELRLAVHALGRSFGATLVPLPISRHRTGTNDWATLRAVVDGYADVDAAALAAEGPAEVIAAAGRCRVVLTGAYHAAVFALAQGVPAVCVAGSDYYRHKFDGLRDLFGDGCAVVPTAGGALGARVEAAVRGAWRAAEALRPGLLAAAARQAAEGRAAFARMAARVRAS